MEYAGESLNRVGYIAVTVCLLAVCGGGGDSSSSPDPVLPAANWIIPE
jgi:hypothetical protein